MRILIAKSAAVKYKSGKHKTPPRKTIFLENVAQKRRPRNICQTQTRKIKKYKERRTDNNIAHVSSLTP